jgi:hypothetical protein
MKLEQHKWIEQADLLRAYASKCRELRDDLHDLPEFDPFLDCKLTEAAERLEVQAKHIKATA